MKKILASAMAAVMAVSLVACGGSTASSSAAASSAAPAGSSSVAASSSAPSGKKTTLTMATGSTSANYYAIGGVMSTVLNDKLSLSSITVTSTGASKANVQLLQDKEANIAIIQNDVSYYAYTGTDLFDGENPYKDFSALCTIYDEVVQIFTLDSSIKTVEDLKGKTVSIGAAGSGDNFAANQIFAAYGMTEKDINPVYQSYSDSAEGMKDGKIDAAFCVSGAPTTALVDLNATASSPLNIISIDDEHAEKLMKDYPFYARTTIKAGTYDKMAADVNTVSIRAMLVASNDVSEDAVYELMKAMFDNLTSLQDGHAKFATLSLQTATNGVSIPYHAGAKKFFQENGVTVD